MRAPGRVNLIGEHTDYNDGFVLPAAIGFSTWVAFAARDDRLVRVHSENLSSSCELSLDDPIERATHTMSTVETARAAPGSRWTDYVRGVAAALEHARYRLRGADLMIDGDVPLGAGLSSSASLEVAVALALLSASDLSIDQVELAQICQRAENDFVGTRCGIMDQLAACCARAGHALLLDCRSLATRYVALPKGMRLVICNTLVKHSLIDGAYNERRAECEAGVRAIADQVPGVRALRDVTAGDLERVRARLSDVVYRRCRHVVTENARVLEMADALERGDLAAAGREMAASHLSLKQDFEVSCRELDTLVEVASSLDGVWGTRMTGAGFGGCTLSLVREDATSDVLRRVRKGYRDAIGREPEVYVAEAADGARPA